MSRMKEYFMASFGEDLSPNDIAERVYTYGWNAALEEAAKQIGQMPFGDTSASFAIFLRNLKERMP